MVTHRAVTRAAGPLLGAVLVVAALGGFGLVAGAADADEGSGGPVRVASVDGVPYDSGVEPTGPVNKDEKGGPGSSPETEPGSDTQCGTSKLGRLCLSASWNASGNVTRATVSLKVSPAAAGAFARDKFALGAATVVIKPGGELGPNPVTSATYAPSQPVAERTFTYSVPATELDQAKCVEPALHVTTRVDSAPSFSSLTICSGTDPRR